MIESLIYLLIQVAVVVLIAYILLWILGLLGVALPPKVVQIFWIIVALIMILLVLRIFMVHSGHLLF